MHPLPLPVVFLSQKIQFSELGSFGFMFLSLLFFLKIKFLAKSVHRQVSQIQYKGQVGLLIRHKIWFVQGNPTLPRCFSETYFFSTFPENRRKIQNQKENPDK